MIWFLACPNCDFDLPPGTAAKPECPVCKAWLHIHEVKQDTHAHHCGGRFEVVPDREVKTSNPPLYAHKCTVCEGEVYAVRLRDDWPVSLFGLATSARWPQEMAG